jgi:hypothetical protein
VRFKIKFSKAKKINMVNEKLRGQWFHISKKQSKNIKEKKDPESPLGMAC